MGAIDGVMIGQTAGGQMGGRSIAPLQSGCICPLAHWQLQSAHANETSAQLAHKARTAIVIFMLRHP
jgi:hypothetical protein